MKGKDILKGLIDAGKPEQATAQAPAQRPAGAIRALNMGLNRLSEEAAEARHLREALANAENVVELDPSLIDPSIVSDRLSLPNDPAFQELKSAIETSGQQVPVLVRPHPEQQGRYQAAYGHRRIRAALELGYKIKAMVRQLAEAEMVIAQGQENGTRVDLSFIERSMFASKLESRGFDRDTICIALGVDKPEASRLLTVASSIDHSIVATIGAAPKVGRPRWLQLAQNLEDNASKNRVLSVMKEPNFESADSDNRFKIAFDAATIDTKKTKIKPTILYAADKKIAVYERDGKKLNIKSSNAAFSDFMEAKINELVLEFKAVKDGNNS